MDGTLQTIDGREALRFERRLAHPVERVWRAVSEPDELARWFVAPAPWTPFEGERFTAAGQGGRVTAMEPPRLLAWEWGDERYSFEVRPEGDESVLVFIHFFDPGLGPGAQHAAGWESYLLRLEVTLDGGSLSEAEAHAIVPELNERYALVMGADPAPARGSFARHGPLQLSLEDGPSLRFERRYGYPVERVWRAISDEGEREAWFPSGVELAVVESDEPQLLVLDFFGQRLTFRLQPDGDGCRLKFEHELVEPGVSARDAAGWDRSFTRLDALLAGSSLAEKESLELWPTVHERYVEAFDADPEVGRAAWEAHPLT